MYNPQLEDPEAVEAAYEAVNTVLDREPYERLAAAAELLEPLPYENPPLGTSYSIMAARNCLRDVLAEDDLRGVERSVVKTVNDILTAEMGSFPGHGTDRHYSLDRQLENL